MAIYSLNHKTVGKSTHAPGTASAHVNYITRVNAAGQVMAERMPENRHQARAWFDQAEAADRKNGRVCDKVMVALPIELDAEQRAELVREFAQEITLGRASWLAAIHDKGKDAGNPHAHIIIRDKDPDTGKRVAGLSEKGSTERLRETWEKLANRALERAGQLARIDRRTLKEQGIERKAQIHVGPKLKAMEDRGARPASQVRQDHRGRVIRYPEIDRDLVKGQRTRAEKNAQIIQLNEVRERQAAIQAKAAAARRAAEEAERQRMEVALARYDAKRAQEAQEAQAAKEARQAREAAKRAQEAQERAAADRYATLVQSCRAAEKAAGGALWQKTDWSNKHPWRARLHRLGLMKAGPLVEIEGREEVVRKAREALGADPEGKRAYEAREAARKAQEAAQHEAAKQEREREQARRRAERAKAPAKPKGRDDFGMGF